jgi:hypothetical protein
LYQEYATLYNLHPSASKEQQIFYDRKLEEEIYKSNQECNLSKSVRINNQDFPQSMAKGLLG